MNRNEILKELEIIAEYLTGYSTQDRSIGQSTFDPNKRYLGIDWPQKSLTMIGMKRMLNIRDLIFDIVDKNIPGDFIETGVWRGGACIFASIIFRTLNADRKVWVCDSFEGLPKPNSKYELDKNDTHHTVKILAVGLEEVQSNFQQFNLLDEKVKFLKGWFCDTLPTLKDETFAIIRLDGDMYGSTIDSLENLYPKLSTGGYVIIDDWALKGAKQAVLDYREKNNINDSIISIEEEGYSCFWQKTS